MPRRAPPRTRKRARLPQYESQAYRRLLRQLASGVRAQRTGRGWTQEEAAHRADMILRQYQRLESGEVNATLTSLARLCDGFGVGIHDLFVR